MNRTHSHVLRVLPAALVVMAMLVLAPAASALTGEPITAAVDGVNAVLRAPGEAVTVGDPVRLVLQVQHPVGYQVLPPKLEQTWGDFSVKSVSPASTVANPDGTETTTLEIDARLFAPGDFQTPPLTVTVTDGSGSLSEATAAPVPVTVASVLKEGDTELRDIKGQAALALPAAWPAILAAVVVVLALAGAVAWVIRRRRKPAVDNRLPHQRALDGLAAIEAMRLPQQGRFKEHYTLVSDCIREYVERGFGVPALERTTCEIEPDLVTAGFTSEVQAALVTLLEDSDIIKFTTLTPDENTAAGLILQGRGIVNATSPKPVEPARAADSRRRGEPVKPEQALEATI